MKENNSDFNIYPHRVFANVVLINGKIANFKTCNYRWTKDNFMQSNQPWNVSSAESRVTTIRSRSFIVKNPKAHHKAFTTKAEKFYKQFELIEDYNLFRPYAKK